MENSNHQPSRRTKRIGLIVIAVVAIIVVIVVAAMFVPFGEMSDRQKLARIAVPEDEVREVTVRGKLLMPDGMPADKGIVVMKSLLHTSKGFFGFARSTGTCSHDGGMVHIRDETGEFEFLKCQTGANVIMTAMYDTDGGSSSGDLHLSGRPEKLEKQKLIARPVAFVPEENGPEIVLQYEEGLLVEGMATFDDGKPAAGQRLVVRQYVTPAIGADIPSVQEEMTFITTTRIGKGGKFALYLLPGEYAFTVTDFPLLEERTQKVVIERGKENRIALTAPSPAHFRFELEDGTSPEKINVMHVGAYLFKGQANSLNTFLYSPFDWEERFMMLDYEAGDAISVYPTDMNNYLIVTTYDSEFGLVEKITPQMRGKEITLTLLPAIKVTESTPPSQKYTRQWEFQYFDAKRYAVRHGAAGHNHVFESDENGRLEYAIPVYAGDYKDLFFFLAPGESQRSGGEQGSGKSQYNRKKSDPPLHYVDPETQKIKPYYGP